MNEGVKMKVNRIVGEVIIEPYQIEDFTNILMGNGYRVELSHIKRDSKGVLIKVIIKQRSELNE